MACSCANNGNGNGNGGMDTCVQQSTLSCQTAYTAVTNCIDAVPCGTACTGNNSSNGLTANGNTINFGNTGVGSAPSRCMTVTGPNASTILGSATLPQVLNDTSCAAGCAFSAQPLYCSTSDSCDVCVIFAPNKVGAATATLSITSGLTVALSGVGTASSNTGTGGTSGTGGSVVNPIGGAGGVVINTGGTGGISTGGTGTGGIGGTSTSSTCGPVFQSCSLTPTSVACLSCFEQSCGNEAAAVFGSGWANGQRDGGLCPNAWACGCTGLASTDLDSCLKEAMNSDCTAATTALNNCADANPCCAECPG
jgi:hypothetical protein